MLLRIPVTFCASRDTRVSYGWCLLIQRYFWAVQNYKKKADLSKCSLHSRRKLGVTMLFSEIFKLQFEKKKKKKKTKRKKKPRHTLLCILMLPRCPQFSFWIPVSHAKICFSRIVINCAKILLYQEASSLNVLVNQRTFTTTRMLHCKIQLQQTHLLFK